MSMDTHCLTCDSWDTGRRHPSGADYCEECLDVECIEYVEEDDDDDTDDPLPTPFGGYDDE